MPTTTNYGWTTPADTDLVKDGAAAIRTLGSGADTTVKNLNPGTTAGDIDYYTSSTAKARVAIGTAGQVLRVNSGATAPEWGTIASGGMTLLNSGNTTLSGSTITFSSLGGYETLLINVYGVNPSSATAICTMRFNSDTANNYAQFEDWSQPGVADGRNGQATQSAINLNRFGRSYLAQNTTNFWTFTVPEYARTSTRVISYNSIELDPGARMTAGTAQYNGSSAITSLTVLVDTGTFSAGTCEIWGLK
jgi:hypothetical protein